MIQLNVGAKPYNVCEEVMGTELFFMMQKTQLIGSHYYNPQPPAYAAKDVLGLVKVSWKTVEKQLMKEGFKAYWALFGGIVTMWQPKDGGTKIFVTSDYSIYSKFCVAQEVCKYLGPGSKQDIANIHKIIIEGALVMGEQLVIPEEENHPPQHHPAAVNPGLGFGHVPNPWAAQGNNQGAVPAGGINQIIAQVAQQGVDWNFDIEQDIHDINGG